MKGLLKYFAILATVLVSTSLAKDIGQRKGHIFSLFNVVKFENGPCRSTNQIASSSGGNAYRNGTCYTQKECSDKGGTAAGNCASAFGICCVFLVEEGDVSENCTYIRNPGFNSAYSETDQVTYTIRKCDEKVCHVRLDFETFTIRGPDNTEELNGGACTDTMTTRVNSGHVIPVICGVNTGQHMYMDIGRDNDATATIEFSFDGDDNMMRMWEIKVSQITCNADHAPPSRCLQYHTGLTGTITTFNWMGNGNIEQHLANQDYSVCIRQEEGFCCTQYRVCEDDNSFSLSTGDAAITTGDHDNLCTLDYVGIEGSSDVCDAGRPVSVSSRYCGTFLSRVAGENAANRPVCDCSAPFHLDIFTNAISDVPLMPGMPAMPNNVSPSKGVCITYRQLPCN